jgi:hypothetical protein
MGKRSGGRAVGKAKVTRKRGAVKDLSARRGGVVGGLLPAVRAPKLTAADAPAVRGQATEQFTVYYGKIE